jgi:hypothetical protein
MQFAACQPRTLLAFSALPALLAIIPLANGEAQKPNRPVPATLSPAATTAKAAAALGLSATAALGVHAGYVLMERDIHGYEVGATLDLGHFASRRVRLATELSFMRSNPHSERVETEGKTYRAIIQDLNGGVNLNFLLREPTSRFVPFVSGGIGLHALSSAFESLTIDTRYNTNNFSVQAYAGVRIRTGAASRRAVTLAVQRVQANDVSRTSFRIGLDALFNDLARKAP